MAEQVKDFFLGMPISMYIILIMAFGLLVASFIVPPLGVINASVLQGLAEFLGFTWLIYTTANIPNFIERGAKIKASYGGATIEIGRHKKGKKSEEPIVEEATEDGEVQE